MFLFFAFPLIAAIIIITTAARSAEQKKRAEAQRMQQAQETAASVEGQASYTPVRPTVQAPPVRQAAAAPMRPDAYGRVHPQHSDCALRPDQKKPQPANKHPQHDLCSLDENAPGNSEALKKSNAASAQKPGGTILNFTPDNILRGVVFAEVFGKPKALR